MAGKPQHCVHRCGCQYDALSHAIAVQVEAESQPSAAGVIEVGAGDREAGVDSVYPSGEIDRAAWAAGGGGGRLGLVDGSLDRRRVVGLAISLRSYAHANPYNPVAAVTGLEETNDVIGVSRRAYLIEKSAVVRPVRRSGKPS